MKKLICLLIPSFLIICFIGCKSTNSINKSNGTEINDFSFQNIIIKDKGEINLSITQSDHDFIDIDATEEQLDLLTITNEKNKLTITGDKELDMISNNIFIDIEIKDLKSLMIKKGNNHGFKANDNQAMLNL